MQKKVTATVPTESAGTAFDKKRNEAKKKAFCANAVQFTDDGN